MVKHKGISSNQNYTWLMEAWVLTKSNCISGRWCCGKICCHWACPILTQLPDCTLQHFCRLEGREIHWINTGLRLWNIGNAFVNAQISWQGIAMIPAIMVSNSPRITFPPHISQIWQINAVNGTPWWAPLRKDDQCFIEENSRTFLYYRVAVDSTILMALSTLVAQQAKPRDATMAQVKHFLDYFTTHEDAVITWRKSDMMLVMHSDARYLNATELAAIFTYPTM